VLESVNTIIKMRSEINIISKGEERLIDNMNIDSVTDEQSAPFINDNNE